MNEVISRRKLLLLAGLGASIAVARNCDANGLRCRGPAEPIRRLPQKRLRKRKRRRKRERKHHRCASGKTKGTVIAGPWGRNYTRPGRPLLTRPVPGVATVPAHLLKISAAR